MKADRFYQFPLSALGFGPNCHTRLAHVISWCIYDVGTKAVENPKCPADALLANADKETLPDDFDEDNEAHRAIYAGALTLEIKPAAISCRDVVDQHVTLQDHIDAQAALEGPAQIVRTRFDLFMDAFAGRMPWRDFSVLCAVYASLGNWKIPRVLCMETFAPMALGFKVATAHRADWLSILDQRKDGAELLTRNQIRGTLDRLEASGWFSRVRLDRRHVQYSHCLTRAEIHKWNRERSLGNKIKRYRAEDRAEQALLKAKMALSSTVKPTTTTIQPTTRATTQTTTRPTTTTESLLQKPITESLHDVRLHAPLTLEEHSRKPEGNRAFALEEKERETKPQDASLETRISNAEWFRDGALK